MAFARVMGSVCRNAAELSVRRYLIEKVRQHGCISNTAAGDLDRSDLQGLLVDPYMYLAPQTAFGAAELARIPFSLALSFDSCTIYQQVRGPG